MQLSEVLELLYTVLGGEEGITTEEAKARDICVVLKEKEPAKTNA